MISKKKIFQHFLINFLSKIKPPQKHKIYINYGFSEFIKSTMLMNQEYGFKLFIIYFIIILSQFTMYVFMNHQAIAGFFSLISLGIVIFPLLFSHKVKSKDLIINSFIGLFAIFLPIYLSQTNFYINWILMLPVFIIFIKKSHINIIITTVLGLYLIALLLFFRYVRVSNITQESLYFFASKYFVLSIIIYIGKLSIEKNLWNKYLNIEKLNLFFEKHIYDINGLSKLICDILNLEFTCILLYNEKNKQLEIKDSCYLNRDIKGYLQNIDVKNIKSLISKEEPFFVSCEKIFSKYRLKENKLCSNTLLLIPFIRKKILIAVIITALSKKNKSKAIDIFQFLYSKLSTHITKIINTSRYILNYEFSETLLKTISELIIYSDENNIIVWANKAAKDFFGNDIIGKYIFEITANSNGLYKNILSFISQNKDFYNKEIILQNTIGKKIIALCYSAKILQDNKKFIITTIKDISEIHKLREELFQKEKMLIIEQLINRLAHDFNNQISGILGFIELIKLKKNDPEKVIYYTDKALEGIEQAKNMTYQLLSFSRETQHLDSLIDINHLIKETVNIIKGIKNKNKIIKMELYSDSPIIQGDPSQIKNMLMNILINANEALQENGNIKIKTYISYIESKEFKKKYSFNIKSDTYCSIVISDNGQGMDKNTLNHIFEPFFSQSPYRHKGLGLTVAYSIVKKHKGAIDVQSSLGKGTKVSLYLPIVKSSNDVKIKIDI